MSLFCFLRERLSPGAAISYIWESLSQKRCPVCSCAHNGLEALCSSCLSALECADETCCPVCGQQVSCFTHDKTPCIKCLADPPEYGRLYFFGPYEGLLRNIILEWKFACNIGLSGQLSRLAADAALNIAPEVLPDLIIPVPLHPSRLRERGFNQSLTLSKSVGRTLKRPVAADKLFRTRRTSPQTRLNHTQRRNNLSGAFRTEGVAGKRILLVDDVMTSGSTVDECCRTLHEGGCTTVDVLVLARARLDN